MANLPKEMKALRYTKPEEYGIVTVPLPKLRDNDVLIKVKACGVCGTDLHIHEGEFIAKFPLIPGTSFSLSSRCPMHLLGISEDTIPIG
jgi:D-arabinitol dehydrogenase (NADP+)